MIEQLPFFEALVGRHAFQLFQRDAMKLSACLFPLCFSAWFSASAHAESPVRTASHDMVVQSMGTMNSADGQEVADMCRTNDPNHLPARCTHMNPNTFIERYIAALRNGMAKFLGPDMGLACTVYPALTGGAVLDFKMGRDMSSADTYKPQSKSLGAALAQVEQRTFVGNIENFHFSGSSMVMEPQHFILIKDADAAHWSDAAAENDLKQVVQKMGLATR
jgi:hypothetical protein